MKRALATTRFQQAAIACVMAFALVFAANDTRAKDPPATLIAHEKDLVNDTKGIGVGSFSWSPDSRRIAYLKWNLGEVGIVDIATGKITDIPGLNLRGLRNFAWSSDGNLLAVNSGPELKIVRLSDSKITNHVNVFEPGFDSNVRFGEAMAFSKDGTKLLFENPNNYDHIILARYDLATNTIEPMLRSPFEARRASPLVGSGRFQRQGDRLHFSVGIRRDDEVVRQSKIIGNTDYGRALRPVTCFVFDLADGSGVVEIRSMDFPPPGHEQADGSKDIVDCRYSTASDSFVVRRRYPLIFDGEVPPFPKSQGSFYEGIKVGATEKGRSFPTGESPEQRSFYRDYELHPFQPWAVTLAYPPQHNGVLTVWDFVTGEALARVELDIPLFSFAISPDGGRAAFSTRLGDRISVYRFGLQ
jgi:hypothetical protein